MKHNHEYITGEVFEDAESCKHCGLLRSTIEQEKKESESAKPDWQREIASFVVGSLAERYLRKIIELVNQEKDISFKEGVAVERKRIDNIFKYLNDESNYEY